MLSRKFVDDGRLSVGVLALKRVNLHFVDAVGVKING